MSYCLILGLRADLFLVTNNVLDWSKLESNMDTVCRPTPLDVRAVSESIVHTLLSKEEDVDVEFMVAVSPSVPKALLLDETYVHRILMNLLSNAFKFTNSGYILLTMEYDGTDLIVQVRDTGIGIPPVFLPRLFEPFSQAQTRGSQRGTGLGLSIIKQLLHKMGGTISVDSHYSETQQPNIRSGTTFTTRIPAQAPSVGSILPEPLADLGTVVVFPRANPISQEGQGTALEHLGYKVIRARSLSEIKQRPDLKYIWIDAEYLLHHLDCLDALLLQDTWTVLVPYRSQEILHRLPGVVTRSRFVLLPKPLMLHTFQARIALANRPSPNEHEIPRRSSKPFVSTKQATATASANREVKILLVEDNPVITSFRCACMHPVQMLTITACRSTKS